MDSLNWISLAEYSAKYKVSVSTLRRRIKNDKIEYAFDNGKYFLPDLELNAISKAKKSFSQAAPPNTLNSAPSGLQIGQHFLGKDFLESLEREPEELSERAESEKQGVAFHNNETTMESNQDFFNSEMFSRFGTQSFASQTDTREERPEAAMKSAKTQEPSSDIKEALDHMTKELKKAYSAILQEKEEQLIILKEQVADLKTLVNILESENQKLNDSMADSFLTPQVIREKTQF